MSELTDAQKRAKKAAKTRAATKNANELVREELARKDKALAKVRAENKAIKAMIAEGWRPKE